MKTNLFKIAAIALVVAGGLISCNEKTDGDTDDLFLEISPDSKSQIIEKEIEGITFKFCLLNEQGQPTTVFSEGENIIFNFSIENNLKKSISFPTPFINDEFYRVYGNDHTDMGKAWTGSWCYFSLHPRIIKLATHEEKQLKCPWTVPDDFSYYHLVDYPLCKEGSMDSLPRGVYSTSLNFDFPYTIEEKQKSIKSIKFKINFQIK